MKKLSSGHRTASDYKKLTDRLLKLLFAAKHNPRSGYQDMVMRDRHAYQLDLLLKKEHRYEWKKLGETEHLLDLALNPPLSVAFVVASSPRRVEWHILGRRPFNGFDRSLGKAKAKVEFHFETITSEE